MSFDKYSFDKSFDLSFKSWADKHNLDYASINKELVSLGFDSISDEMSVSDVASLLS